MTKSKYIKHVWNDQESIASQIDAITSELNRGLKALEILEAIHNWTDISRSFLPNVERTMGYSLAQQNVFDILAEHGYFSNPQN